MHRYLLHNGEIRNTHEPLLSPGQTGFMTGWGVFSTLRISNGVLFAFERHYHRMQRDAARLRVPFDMSAEELEAALLRLVEANEAQNGTLRVSIVRNRGGAFEGDAISRDTDLVAFTADLKDWGWGVKLGYVPHGRHGASPYAGAKVTSWAFNLTWYEQAHEQGLDEVILLNEEGQISECTSANIFIISGDRVLTPPLHSSGCLPGITRALLLEEIRVPGLTVAEAEITPSQLEDARQVFITSTTRDLLPVLAVENERLQQDEDTLALLQSAFTRYRDEYVKAHGTTAKPRQLQTTDA